MGVFASTPRAQPLFPPPSMTGVTPNATASGGGSGSGAAVGLNSFATVGSSASLVGGLAGSMALTQPPPGSQQQQQGGGDAMLALSTSSSLSSTAAAGSGADGGTAGIDAKVKEALLLQQQQQQPWVSVGGSWRDEENVCGYWRFSEGAAIIGGLEEGKQVHQA